MVISNWSNSNFLRACYLQVWVDIFRMHKLFSWVGEQTHFQRQALLRVQFFTPLKAIKAICASVFQQYQPVSLRYRRRKRSGTLGGCDDRFSVCRFLLLLYFILMHSAQPFSTRQMQFQSLKLRICFNQVASCYKWKVDSSLRSSNLDVTAVTAPFPKKINGERDRVDVINNHTLNDYDNNIDPLHVPRMTEIQSIFESTESFYDEILNGNVSFPIHHSNGVSQPKRENASIPFFLEPVEVNTNKSTEIKTDVTSFSEPTSITLPQPSLDLSSAPYNHHRHLGNMASPSDEHNSTVTSKLMYDNHPLDSLLTETPLAAEKEKTSMKRGMLMRSKNITSSRRNSFMRFDTGKASSLKNTSSTTKSMWSRRNARSAEEGIRREKTDQLSSLLARAESFEMTSLSTSFAARTISGLLHALADESDDLEVEVESRRDTPFWAKRVDFLRIKFSRLSFRPISFGGRVVRTLQEYGSIFPDTEQGAFVMDQQLQNLSCADEAFGRIDTDNSGGLDSDELANALSLASGTLPEEKDSKKKQLLLGLAVELVALYDVNGDGFVDRAEYQCMVEDMAALRGADSDAAAKETNRSQREDSSLTSSILVGIQTVGSRLSSLLGNLGDKVTVELSNASNGPFFPKALAINGEKRNISYSTGKKRNITYLSKNGTNESDLIGASFQILDTELDEDILADSGKTTSINKTESNETKVSVLGAITLSGLKLDLRRLIFGWFPILKHIIPGGPLVLEPFTFTVSGSFNRGDIMESPLLDSGLRLLAAQAIKLRVRSLRDFIDGAVFHGRSWKMSCVTAPVVEVPELINVEFDGKNRLIITGRARIKPRSEVPVFEQSFKLRTKIGTRQFGRKIRLIEPELALVLECPKKLEEFINRLFDSLGLDLPEPPEPLYSFFPIYSPFTVKDDNGFDLGEDNRVKTIYVQDNALRFEMSAILRPGRFLGNHYIAFSLPQRTFIITTDRVREAIRAARLAKKAAKALKKVAKERQARESGALQDRNRFSRNNGNLSSVSVRITKYTQIRSFFSRFVDGYLQAERDEANGDKVTTAIRDFFGQQGQLDRI